MKYVMCVLLLCGLLVGCDSGGSTSAPAAGAVGIKCADLSNSSSTSRCDSTVSGVSMASGAITIIDAGVLQRTELAYVTLVVLNGTPDAWNGYWGATFDVGCAGLPDPWYIAPVQPTGNVDAGAEWTVTVGGQCGDMPLGARTMTATLYDTDPATVLDVVQVQFELIE